MAEKGRRWCFTINNPDDDEDNASLLYDLKQNERIIFLITEMEHQEDGTPHLQGYLEYSNSTTRQNISNLLRNKAFVQLARGDRKENALYCSKEFREGSTEYIDCKGITIEEIKELKEDETKKKGNRSASRKAKIDRNLYLELQTSTWDELQEKHPDIVFNDKKKIDQIKMLRKRDSPEQTPTLKMKNYWLKGPKGCGKTSWVLTKSAELGAQVYHKSLNKWWDGFLPDEHEVVLIDDFDPNVDITIKAMLKKWADRYELQEEVKGGFIKFFGNDFCLAVTSNYSIEECFHEINDIEPIKRRFLYIDCDQFKDVYGKSIDRLPFFPYFFLKRGFDPSRLGIDLSDPVWKEEGEDFHYTKKHDIGADTDPGNWIEPESLQIACRINGAGEMTHYKDEKNPKFKNPDLIKPIYEAFGIDPEPLEKFKRKQAELNLMIANEILRQERLKQEALQKEADKINDELDKKLKEGFTTDEDSIEEK